MAASDHSTGQKPSWGSSRQGFLCSSSMYLFVPFLPGLMAVCAKLVFYSGPPYIQCLSMSQDLLDENEVDPAGLRPQKAMVALFTLKHCSAEV